MRSTIAQVKAGNMTSLETGCNSRINYFFETFVTFRLKFEVVSFTSVSQRDFVKNYWVEFKLSSVPFKTKKREYMRKRINATFRPFHYLHLKCTDLSIVNQKTFFASCFAAVFLENYLYICSHQLFLWKPAKRGLYEETKMSCFKIFNPNIF